MKKVSQPREKFITSKDSFVNEADLLKDSHNIFANGLKDKEVNILLNIIEWLR